MNKSNIKMILSPDMIPLSFSWEKKVILFELGEKCARTKHCLQVKTVWSSSKQMWWILRG